MRIFLSHRREERGATAIFVAVLAVVLVGIASFTLDFGQAYVSKRQLQTATDAAALAASQVFATHAGTCKDFSDPSDPKYDPSLTQSAQNTADDVLHANLPTANASAISLACDGAGRLVVGYTSTAKTPVTLGAVYGQKSISFGTHSEATLGVAPGATGVRPYAFCSRDLPTAADYATGSDYSYVMKISMPGTGTAPPVCTQPSGGWWVTACPEGKDIESATEVGCKQEISVVPGQDTIAATDTLSNYLLNESPGCGAGYSDDCLGPDTGNDFTGHGLPDYWKNHLVGSTLIFPVFCGGANCDPDAIDDKHYPVYRLVALKVCGFHFNKNTSDYSQIYTGACASSNNPHGYDASTGGNNETYFLGSYTQVMVGGSAGPDDCALGDKSCDGGLRTAVLTE